MGLFSKLFGGKKSPDAPEAEAAPEPEPVHPDVVVVLRRGMNLPNAEYVGQVVASLFPSLPETIPRVGLSQPSWFKTEEVADSIAAGVAETFAAKLELEGVTTRRRAVAGPDGCQVLVVELYRG